MKIRAFLTDNKKSLLGFGLLSCMPLVFSSLVAALLFHHESWLLGLETLQWLPLYLLSAISMALAMTPSTFIALVSGYFLGWNATAFTLAAYLLASALGYKAGQFLDGGRLLKSLQRQKKVRQFLEGLRLQEWPLMIMVRLSPVMPFAVMNLLMPALKIRFNTFLIAGFFGMLPRTLFSIGLGIQAKGLINLLQTPDDHLSSAVFFIVMTILSAGGLIWLIQRTARQILSGKYFTPHNFDYAYHNHKKCTLTDHEKNNLSSSPPSITDSGKQCRPS
ncbi:TVP38/TMEM64 family protein [Endozoicomonas euniceicola]|uniref:TVP38/TMEM64 family membrane protein n=1 Tax=Endozoicomonas euniceicola TaxID=1234143 RepID=A0ABY6GPG0_9GAMM|nr:VTT domain-containing protein [Endozoicomonas euniceicola]UYM14304.1 VTT domain-containing protein [Endozoicomonas euniceicola]